MKNTKKTKNIKKIKKEFDKLVSDSKVEFKLANLDRWYKDCDKYPLFDNAAKVIAKDVQEHFKKGKWSLDYHMLLNEVFFEAVGENLESFLVRALGTKGSNLKIVYSGNKPPMLTLVKK